jgi:hypothetical protein
MGWTNPQWVRLQQHGDYDLVTAAVAIQEIFMEAAENLLLHQSGLAGPLIEGMQAPGELNKYRQERNALISSGKVDEASLRREAINLLISR